MKHFESFMASKLQEYVVYRRALGYAKKAIDTKFSWIWPLGETF